jgi:putative tryptophan/tyrosine transport system substrate-binding protein
MDGTIACGNGCRFGQSSGGSHHHQRGTTLVANAARAATATIPIVFQGGGGDPVSLGLVASLNRPGGNVTGVINLTGQSATQAKVVQLLRELVPAAGSLVLLVNRATYPRGSFLPAEAAARELHWEYQVFEASTPDDLTTAFEAVAKRKVGAANVCPRAFLYQSPG